MPEENLTNNTSGTMTDKERTDLLVGFVRQAQELVKKSKRPYFKSKADLIRWILDQSVLSEGPRLQGARPKLNYTFVDLIMIKNPRVRAESNRIIRNLTRGKQTGQLKKSYERGNKLAAKGLTSRKINEKAIDAKIANIILERLKIVQRQIETGQISHLPNSRALAIRLSRLEKLFGIVRIPSSKILVLLKKDPLLREERKKALSAEVRMVKRDTFRKRMAAIKGGTRRRLNR